MKNCMVHCIQGINQMREAKVREAVKERNTLLVM